MKKKKHLTGVLMEQFDVLSKLFTVCFWMISLILAVYSGCYASRLAYDSAYGTSLSLTSLSFSPRQIGQKSVILLGGDILLSVFFFFVYVLLFHLLLVIIDELKDTVCPRVISAGSKFGAVRRCCYLPLLEDEIQVTADRTQNGTLHHGKLYASDAQAYFLYVAKQMMYKGVYTDREYLPLSTGDLRAMLMTCLKVFDDPNGTIFTLTARETKSWKSGVAGSPSPCQFFDDYQKRRVCGKSHVSYECVTLLKNGHLLLSYICTGTDSSGKTDCSCHSIEI